MSRCGMLINWIFGARSRNSQLKMNTTMSAGDAAVGRIANRSCMSKANVTAALENTNSMPAEAKLFMNTISTSTTKSASSTLMPSKFVETLMRMI